MKTLYKAIAGLTLCALFSSPVQAATSVEDSLTKGVDWRALDSDIRELGCNPPDLGQPEMHCYVRLTRTAMFSSSLVRTFELEKPLADMLMAHRLGFKVEKGRIHTSYPGASMPKDQAVAAINKVFSIATKFVSEQRTRVEAAEKNRLTYK